MAASASSQYSLGQPDADTALAKYTGLKDCTSYAKEHPLTEVDHLPDGDPCKLQLAICHVVLSLTKSPPKNDADKDKASWVKRWYTKKGEKDLRYLCNPKPEEKVRVAHHFRKIKVWLDERGTQEGLPADQKAAGEHMTAVGNRLEHNIGGKMDSATIAMKEAVTFAQSTQLEAEERITKVERLRKEEKANFERKQKEYKADYERKLAEYARRLNDSDRGRGGGSCRRHRSRSHRGRRGSSRGRDSHGRTR